MQTQLLSFLPASNVLSASLAFPPAWRLESRRARKTLTSSSALDKLGLLIVQEGAKTAITAAFAFWQAPSVSWISNSFLIRFLFGEKSKHVFFLLLRSTHPCVWRACFETAPLALDNRAISMRWGTWQDYYCRSKLCLCKEVFTLKMYNNKLGLSANQARYFCINFWYV